MEADYVARCQAGDQRAFAPLISPYRRPLFTYLLRMTQSHHNAEDLLQETLLRAWEGLSTYREEGNFRSWLFRIGHNVTIKAINRARVRSHLTAIDVVGEPVGSMRADENSLHKELVGVVEEAVASLPTKQRRVFLLRQHGEVSFREIAQMTGAPLSTVLSQMHYAVQKIQKALDAYNVS